MARKTKTAKFLRGSIGLILIGVASWAFYSMINQGASDLLMMWGVSNVYAQNALVIGFVIVFGFIILGMGISNIIKAIVEG